VKKHQQDPRRAKIAPEHPSFTRCAEPRKRKKGAVSLAAPKERLRGMIDNPFNRLGEQLGRIGKVKKKNKRITFGAVRKGESPARIQAWVEVRVRRKCEANLKKRKRS